MVLRPARPLRQNVAVPSPSKPAAPAWVRVAYAAVYAGLAAVGFALLARPSLLWVGGLGLRGPVLAAAVPSGGPSFALALLLCGATLRLASSLARGSRPRIPEHAAILVLLACALLLRGLALAPEPPEDPAPALRAGLAGAARALDESYSAHARYRADPASLDAAVGALRAPGFVLRGRRLPLRVSVIEGAARAQTEPLAGDPPGTIYVALTPDRSRAFLTALTLQGERPAVLRQDGRPLILQARGGTHGEPGQDPLLPAYPGQRPWAGKR